MKKKTIITILSLPILIGIIFAIFKIYIIRQKQYEIKTYKSLSAITITAKKVAQIWKAGPLGSNGHKCSGITQRQKTRNKCNSKFLECILREKNTFRTVVSKDKLTVRVLKDKTYVKNTKNGAYLYLVTSLLPENKSKIQLLNNCEDVYLPQNVYGYKQYSGNEEEENYQWDNYNRHIFIDKYQVSYYDIYLWKRLSPTPVNIELDQAIQFSQLPITTLTALEMKEYCKFKEKKILSAQVFDAATFLPNRKNVNNVITVFRYPYPWSNYTKNSFINRAKNKKKLEVTKELCSKIYSYECSKQFQYQNIKMLSYTWTGIFDLFGGYPEYVTNDRDPKENLIATSKYFSIKSSWHQLGARAYWDGEGHRDTNFSWENKLFKSTKYDLPKINASEKIGVAFRCMKVINE